MALGRWESGAELTEVEVPANAEDMAAAIEGAGYSLVPCARGRPGIYILMFTRAGAPFQVLYLAMSRRLEVTSLLAGGRGSLTTTPQWSDSALPYDLVQVIEHAPLEELVRAHLDALCLLDAQGLVDENDPMARPREHLEALQSIGREALRRPLGLAMRIAFHRATRRSFGPLEEQAGVQWRIAKLRAISR